MSLSDEKRNRLMAIFYYFIASIAGALGQFCFKKIGVELSNKVEILSLVLNPYLVSSIALYFLVMILFVKGFKLGGEMSSLYPVYGLTFVWALGLAALFLGEKIVMENIVGIMLIIMGIILLNIKIKKI